MRPVRLLAVGLLVLLVGFAAAVWAYNHFVSYHSRLVAWPAQEVGDTKPPRAWQLSYPRTVRILALDGGGIRGLIALEVLKYLEETSGKPVAELFDVVAGTSTGAIIATQLLLADDHGKPQYAVADVIELYDDMVARVFETTWYHRVLTLGGLLGPRYANEEKIEIAREVYGDASFRDLLLPVLIPCYSIEEADLHLFNNWSPKYAAMFVAPLIVAATSGPTFFPGVKLEGLPQDAGVYMDGALLDSDPAQEVFLRALEQFPDAGVVMLSLGTGLPEFGLSVEASKRGGILAWLKPLIKIAIDGRGQLASTWLERYAGTQAAEGFQYYRFDTVVPQGEAKFDSTTPEHVRYLRQTGRALVAQNQDRLDHLIRQLTGL